MCCVPLSWITSLLRCFQHVHVRRRHCIFSLLVFIREFCFVIARHPVVSSYPGLNKTFKMAYTMELLNVWVLQVRLFVFQVKKCISVLPAQGIINLSVVVCQYYSYFLIAFSWEGLGACFSDRLMVSCTQGSRFESQSWQGQQQNSYICLDFN